MDSNRNKPLNVLVLGVGNTVMTDDGVGVKVVELLQREHDFPPFVELIDGGTLGLDLLPVLEGRSHLIMVDAVDSGQAPGTRVRLAGEQIPLTLETKVSPHQMGLKDLLAVARLMRQLPPEMVLIGVQPRSIDIGLELTPEVAAQIEPMKAAVLEELKSIGVSLSSGEKVLAGSNLLSGNSMPTGLQVC